MCLQCHEKGHFTRRCPKEQCPNCKEYGHSFKDCYVYIILDYINSRQSPNVVDVRKLDIPIVIVQKGVAKLVGNQLIDDMNVEHVYQPRNTYH
jgi:hypothetical protein